jgi:hypothetical protein
LHWNQVAFQDHLALDNSVLGIASAKADDRFTCPVTKPASVTLPTGTSTGLLGTEKLWTIVSGNWQTTQKTERGYLLRRVGWGTSTFDLKQEGGNPSLTITGRRLDADSAPLQFGRVTAAWSGVKDQFVMLSEFYVPTLGCWEVTGHFHGTDLAIVVDLK